MIIIFICVFLLVVEYFLFTARINKIKAAYLAAIKAERADAVKKSKATMRGQISEHIMPLFPDFPYDISELKLLSQPIDFVVFKGMGDIVADKEGAQMELIIAEVKTGKAQPTKIQKAIKEAIEKGRVRYELWRINEDRTIKIT